MKISKRIYELRKGKGISQEQLSAEIGVSRQAISKWESNQSLPDIEKVLLLSEYFDVSTDYLLTGIELDSKMKFSKDKNITFILMSLFFLISLIITYSANRFRTREMVFIAICSSLIGLAISHIIKYYKFRD